MDELSQHGVGEGRGCGEQGGGGVGVPERVSQQGVKSYNRHLNFSLSPSMNEDGKPTSYGRSVGQLR